MPLPVLVTEITDEYAQELCEHLSQAAYIYYPQATFFFLDLYSTGCRPMELLDQTRWTESSPGVFTLTPLKGNLQRTFTESELSANLVFAIRNNIKPYTGLTLRQLTSVLKKVMPVQLTATVGKSAIDYIFRYNRAKQMYYDGVPLATIQATFGWGSLAVTSGYIMRQLYASPPLPVFETFFIIDSNGDVIIDNESNTLNSEP